MSPSCTSTWRSPALIEAASSEATQRELFDAVRDGKDAVAECLELGAPEGLDLARLDKLARECLRLSLGECRLRRSEPCARRSGFLSAATGSLVA